jgi:hypothetical protein
LGVIHEIVVVVVCGGGCEVLNVCGSEREL